VWVDGAPPKASQRAEAGETVEVHIPLPAGEARSQPQPIPLNIVYEDADILVIDKPAGMVAHPAPGHPGGTLVNAVLHHCPEIEGVGGERRPGIVHRLDRETSGLIVVAKNDRAHRALQAQFKNRTVYKEYLALVEGKVEPAQGRIVAPIGRHPTARQRQAILLPDSRAGTSAGREAITEYEVIAAYSAAVQGSNAVGNFSLVRVVLRTGRTHQIRVHFAWIKHPVVGDTLYGYRKQRLALGRHFLHAQRLRFHLPGSDQEVDFTSPLPDELQSLLDIMAHHEAHA
jgi:23S rRNA pseudouridine1911/1915/1917 synthase